MNIPEDIQELFRNKKICIVAGGDITPLSGGHIDNDFDIVVRLNNMHNIYPYSDKIKKDYGEKCDILFREHHGMWGMMNQMGDKEYADILFQIGVKDIILYDCLDSCESMVDRIRLAGGDRFKYHRLPEESSVLKTLSKFYSRASLPATGITAITMIASCSPKSIDLFGFTFYYDYNENIYNPELGKVRNEIPNDPEFGHNFKADLLIFASHLYWLCEINIDPLMRNIISEKVGINFYE